MTVCVNHTSSVRDYTIPPAALGRGITGNKHACCHLEMSELLTRLNTTWSCLGCFSVCQPASASTPCSSCKIPSAVVNLISIAIGSGSFPVACLLCLCMDYLLRSHFFQDPCESGHGFAGLSRPQAGASCCIRAKLGLNLCCCCALALSRRVTTNLTAGDTWKGLVSLRLLCCAVHAPVSAAGS